MGGVCDFARATAGAISSVFNLGLADALGVLTLMLFCILTAALIDFSLIGLIIRLIIHLFYCRDYREKRIWDRELKSKAI